MPKKLPSRMSDAAVKKATGRTWPEWFKILDKFPKNKTHTERAQWLWANHLPKGWWVQMVTVTYEQARGLRAKHQVVGGYQVSGSRTVAIPVAKLFSWWTVKRRAWLTTKGIEVSSATKNKYLHLNWPGGTKVDINFWAKGKTKSMVQVQHSRLKSAAAGKKMKAWWADTLDQFTTRVAS